MGGSRILLASLPDSFSLSAAVCSFGFYMTAPNLWLPAVAPSSAESAECSAPSEVSTGATYSKSGPHGEELLRTFRATPRPATQLPAEPPLLFSELHRGLNTSCSPLESESTCAVSDPGCPEDFHGVLAEQAAAELNSGRLERPLRLSDGRAVMVRVYEVQLQPMTAPPHPDRSAQVDQVRSSCGTHKCACGPREDSVPPCQVISLGQEASAAGGVEPRGLNAAVRRAARSSRRSQVACWGPSGVSSLESLDSGALRTAVPSPLQGWSAKSDALDPCPHVPRAGGAPASSSTSGTWSVPPPAPPRAGALPLRPSAPAVAAESACNLDCLRSCAGAPSHPRPCLPSGDSIPSSGTDSAAAAATARSRPPARTSGGRCLCIEVAGGLHLAPEDWIVIKAQVVRMLRLGPADSRQVDHFHGILPEARAAQYGRLFRSPTLFEDMVKCILLCNCTWGRALSMCSALCGLQAGLYGGAAMPQAAGNSNSNAQGRGAFPLPAELAGLEAAFLGRRCGLGYRTERVLRLARGVVSGEFDLPALECMAAALCVGPEGPHLSPHLSPSPQLSEGAGPRDAGGHGPSALAASAFTPPRPPPPPPPLPGASAPPPPPFLLSHAEKAGQTVFSTASAAAAAVAAPPRTTAVVVHAADGAAAADPHPHRPPPTPSNPTLSDDSLPDDPGCASVPSGTRRGCSGPGGGGAGAASLPGAVAGAARGGAEEAALPPWELQVEALRARVAALPGFGPYSAANVLQCLGLYSIVPADSETLRHLRQVRGIRHCLPAAASVVAQAVYRQFEPFQFLVYWWELKASYEAAFGLLSGVPREAYELFTGRNTSTRMEAALVRCPTLSFLPECLRASVLGTLADEHIHRLAAGSGGPRASRAHRAARGAATDAGPGDTSSQRKRRRSGGGGREEDSAVVDGGLDCKGDESVLHPSLGTELNGENSGNAAEGAAAAAAARGSRRCKGPGVRGPMAEVSGEPLLQGELRGRQADVREDKPRGCAGRNTPGGEALPGLSQSAAAGALPREDAAEVMGGRVDQGEAGGDARGVGDGTRETVSRTQQRQGDAQVPNFFTQKSAAPVQKRQHVMELRCRRGGRGAAAAATGGVGGGGERGGGAP